MVFMQNTLRSLIAFSSLLLLLFAGACNNGGSTQGRTPFVYHEGDIIFQSLPRNPLVRAIEGTTKSDWSHCGVIMKERGEWVVYEALGTVRRTPLAEWIRRGRSGGKFEVCRLKSDIVFDVEKLRRGLQPFLGKAYDFHYAPDDSEIYCSELVYKAYERSQDIKIGTWQALGALDWKPFESFILTIEPSVPLERMMITPVALTRSGLVERVHAGKAD